MSEKIEVHACEASNLWQNKSALNDAERDFYSKSKSSPHKRGKEDRKGQKGLIGQQKRSLAAEIEKTRQHIKMSLECVDGIAGMVNTEELTNRIKSLELENKNLVKLCNDTRSLVLELQDRVHQLEGTPKKQKEAEPVQKNGEKDDEDDVDLFGSDDEDDEETKRIREERLKAYAEKKSKKPKVIAKTSVLLDVKPWDDQTDLKELLKCIKTIEKDGLVWGASKNVPIAFGINKLQILCVVEDEKVSIDELSEEIEGFEDFVQSVDVASMQKI